jgi:predicted nucleotidyltransferase
MRVACHRCPVSGPTAFADLNVVLADLSSGVQEILGPATGEGLLVGVYLHGSFALGDADEHSDVDFLVVVRRRLDPEAENGIRDLHRRLATDGRHWSGHLEGSYAPADELGRYDPTRPPWLYVNNGDSEMTWDPHDNSAVVRWILRRRGLAVLGPPAGDLVDDLPRGAVAAETRVTLSQWHDFVVDEPDALDNAWEQTHAVTQHCRFLYAVENDAVASKPGAVRWAIDRVGGEWRGLLEQALVDRAHPWERYRQTSDPALRQPTKEFMALVRELSGVE